MECNYFEINFLILWGRMHIALNLSIQVNVSRIGVPGGSSFPKENLLEVMLPKYVVHKS